MNKVYSRINWENYPSTETPLNETNLNKIDLATDTIDDRVIVFDTTKANQTDLLSCLGDVTIEGVLHKAVEYNSTTGVFSFYFKNGTVIQADLNIEKIPVSFSMDSNGIITMKTADGSTYTADVGSLIKTYTFVDSTEIDFTTTTDASGNKNVTASLIDGSIAEEKLETDFLANCRLAQTQAEASATTSETHSLESEGYAVGKQNGVDVSIGSPYYHNNAKYYSEVAGSTTLESLDDVAVSGKQDGQVLTWDNTLGKWTNAEGGQITVDSAMSTTSENPVQNKVITSAISVKADADDVYDKTETYAKTEVYNKTETYNKTELIDKTTLEGLLGSYSTVVSGLVGDETITFSNANIRTTSILQVFSENTSGTLIGITSMAVTTGQCVVTLASALEEATSFKLWIRNI